MRLHSWRALLGAAAATGLTAAAYAAGLWLGSQAALPDLPPRFAAAGFGPPPLLAPQAGPPTERPAPPVPRVSRPSDGAVVPGADTTRAKPRAATVADAVPPGPVTAPGPAPRSFRAGGPPPPSGAAPEPVLLELRLGRVVGRTVAGFRVGDDALLPLSDFFGLAEVHFTLSAAGRLEAMFQPGNIEVVIEAGADTLRYGRRRIAVPSDLLLWQDGELYLATDPLARLLGLSFEVDWTELRVTLRDPSTLPVARRLRREAARDALLREQEERRAERAHEQERPNWDGLLLDYTVSAPSDDVFGGSSYAGGVGTDVLGGSLETLVRSEGPAREGAVRLDLSWTGVWRESDHLTQLRVGDGPTTGPRFRSIRGAAATNAPYVRPTLLGAIRYDGALAPGWEVEAYRGGALVAFDSVDAFGRFAVDLPVGYGENPVDFVAYGPFGEVREFNRTYRVISNLLPQRRFEYGLSLGDCRSPVCAATGNVDLRYGATKRLTVGAGVEGFWRDSLENLAHPYLSLTGTLSNAWTLELEAVHRAFVRAAAAFEPSINLRLTAELADFATVTDPLITPRGREAQARLTAFLRPIPQLGTFFLDGEVERVEAVTGVFTRGRLGASVQQGGIRWQPYVRVEHNDPVLSPAETQAFTGVAATVLPRPRLGKVLGGLYLRAQFEAEGLSRAANVSALLSRAFGPNTRLEGGVRWNRAVPGASLSLSFSTYLSSIRTATTVVDPADGPVSGSQFVQGSVIWNRSAGRVTFDPGPSLQRAGVTGRVFLDHNGNGEADADEPGLPDVRVVVGANTTRTDAEGRYQVWDVVAFEPIRVRIDTLSLANPLVVPAFVAARVTPGPNTFTRLDLPLVPGGVLEGQVLLRSDGMERGVGGAGLVLVNRRTGETRRLLTFTDGDFYLMGVPPGDYTLTVDERVLTALGRRSEPLSLTVDPRVDDGAVTGLRLVVY